MTSAKVEFYSQREECLNIATHGFGLGASFIGLGLLLWKAFAHGNVWMIVSFGIFGASLIALYAASTFYHKAQQVEKRARLRIVDHAAIYLLIAGSYTPFALVTLHDSVGWNVFFLAWGFALLGAMLKLFFTGKFDKLSTLLYVALGWMILFFIKPLANALSSEGLFWLVAGGAAYTLGAVLYAIKSLKYNHAIFHIFVLLGSFCHFIAVYNYVVPQ